MQLQMVRNEVIDQEELNELKAQLSVSERDRNRAFEEVREIKLRLSKLSGENSEELSILKESLENANKELKSKDKTIVSLQAEVDKFKQFELKLSEKDDALKEMEEQLSHSKASVSQNEDLILGSRKRVEELEVQVERHKESEAKLNDSLANQETQLQEASFLMEKHKLEAASLREKMEALEEERRQKDEASREQGVRLQNEVTVENGGKSATIETKTLLNEVEFLKKELKRAMEAEETKDKALEDLALALKEVASESKQTKEKLLFTHHQLEAVKEEASNLKKMIKSTEDRYEALLKQQQKENDCLSNIVNRLRMEAEESLLAWSGKEIEFVKCIMKAEDEKNVAQAENSKLMKSMREAEGISEKSKEETKKMRDILKQALNEANVAKEAAGLARSENSYLKDSLAEKDKALVSLAQETERLRISEAEANESIKELKRVLTSGSKKEVAKLEKESKELKKVGKKEAGTETPEKEGREKKLSSTFSFDLNQFWPSIAGLAAKPPSKELDDKDDALGGSIFDLVESPEKDSPSSQAYHRRTSSGCSSTDDDTHLDLENFDEDAHFDDMEIERTSQGKKKALLRRFGDLLRRKNSHPHPHAHGHSHPHPSKDMSHPPKEHQSHKELGHPPKEQQSHKELGHPPKEQQSHKELGHPPKEVEHPQKEIAT